MSQSAISTYFLNTSRDVDSTTPLGSLLNNLGLPYKHFLHTEWDTNAHTSNPHGDASNIAFQFIYTSFLPSVSTSLHPHKHIVLQKDV